MTSDTLRRVRAPADRIVRDRRRETHRRKDATAQIDSQVGELFGDPARGQPRRDDGMTEGGEASECIPHMQ